MRLTDEEKAIADEVAIHWAHILDRLDEAWARALAYIAARREAFGDTGPPGTATAAGVAAPRGVVVTDEQREAVQTARLIFAQGGESLDHAADRARATALDALLDAIGAAKGGGE